MQDVRAVWWKEPELLSVHFVYNCPSNKRLRYRLVHAYGNIVFALFLLTGYGDSIHPAKTLFHRMFVTLRDTNNVCGEEEHHGTSIALRQSLSRLVQF